MNPTTPAPQPSVGRSASIISLILGIVGILLILTSYGFFMTRIALVLLSIAIVVGVIGFILAFKTKRLAPTNKVRRAGTVTNIITVVWSLITMSGFVLVIVAGFLFEGGATTPSGARAASEAQINEQKDFAAGETAHIGAWDVAITKVTRNYTPTDAEYDPEPASKNNLTDANDEFVVVEGTQTPNGKTEAVYLEDSYLRLNGYTAINKYKSRDFFPALKNSTSSTVYDFRIIFRIEKGSKDLSLTYPVNIYKATSPIVGTEGMPSEDVVYTLKLN